MKKKTYSKPEIKYVTLVVEKALLSACKNNVTNGPNGDWHGYSGPFEDCSRMAFRESVTWNRYSAKNNRIIHQKRFREPNWWHGQCPHHRNFEFFAVSQSFPARYAVALPDL